MAMLPKVTLKIKNHVCFLNEFIETLENDASSHLTQSTQKAHCPCSRPIEWAIHTSIQNHLTWNLYIYMYVCIVTSIGLQLDACPSQKFK